MFLSFVSRSLGVVAFMLFCQNAFCQKNIFSVKFKDSITVERSASGLVMNHFELSNLTDKPAFFYWEIITPDGWKCISKTGNRVNQNPPDTLLPGQKRNISANLLKLPAASPFWQPVELRIYKAEDTAKQIVTQLIRTTKTLSFYLRKISPDLILTERPDALEFKAILKNSGNMEDVYKISWKNDLHSVIRRQTIVLAPGQDTTLSVSIPVSKGKYATMKKEHVSLSVSNEEKKEELGFLYEKVPSFLKFNPSDYQSVPIQLEGGAMLLRNKVSYYGAVSGFIVFNENQSLAFNYRSKRMGDQIMDFERNTFFVNYRYKNWNFAAGTTPQSTEFLSLGKGFTIQYAKDQDTRFLFSGSLHEEALGENLMNDLIMGSAEYRIRKAKVYQVFNANFDRYYLVNSYLLLNYLSLVERKNLQLNIMLGGGTEEKKREVPGVLKNTNGIAGGYQLGFLKRNWAINSRSSYYSAGFPGLHKGNFEQFHEIRYLKENKFVSLFYQSNRIKANYFRDSLYNSDIFSYNVTKYGMRFGTSNKANIISFSFGNMVQDNYMTTMGLGEMYFADLYGSVAFNEQTSLNFSSNNGFKQISSRKENLIFLSNNTLNFNSQYGGVFGTYNRLPLPVKDNEGIETTETIDGGPFVNFRLFQNNLTGSIRYNFSKSLQEDNLTTGAGLFMQYQIPKAGLRFNLNGYFPLSERKISGIPLSEQKNASFSVIKTLNIPVVFSSKKNADLRVFLFLDENGNGAHDPAEAPIVNGVITINGQVFISDEKGIITLKNTPLGEYRINYSSVNVGSMVPLNDAEETIYLLKDMLRKAPFKQGRVISGNLKINNDSLSNTRLSPGSFKIIVKDTAGNEYSALTDGRGNFSLGVPDGKYTVSLNPLAFENSSYKPEKISFEVNLLEETKAEVQFIVNQKKRKIRQLNSEN